MTGGNKQAGVATADRFWFKYTLSAISAVVAESGNICNSLILHNRIEHTADEFLQGQPQVNRIVNESDLP